MKYGKHGGRHSDQYYKPVKDDLPGIVYRHSWDDWERHVPDPDAVIAGRFFLKRRAMSQFVGWTGEGKSVLAIQFMLCIACGVALLGRIAVPKPRRVLYIQSENDMDILHEIGPSIVKNLKLDRALLKKNFRECTVHACSGESFAVRLEKEIQEWKADFVVIDPYKDYAGGSLNDQETFATWYGAVSPVMVQQRVAILLVTHGTKAGINKDNRGNATAYSSTGDSNLPNTVRTSFELNVRDPDGRYALSFGKVARSTGMVDANGLPLDRLYIRQARDIRHIYWEPCDNQEGAIRLSAYNRLVVFFRNNPEATYQDAVRAKVAGRSAITENWKKAKSWAMSEAKRKRK